MALFNGGPTYANAVSANKDVVSKYFEGLRHLDRPAMLSLLTDDIERVEWAEGFPTSGVPVRGKAAFSESITDPPGPGGLRIEIARMTEENNVVVAEATVHVPMKDGNFVNVRAWVFFEFENGKVRRVDAVTVLLQTPAQV